MATPPPPRRPDGVPIHPPQHYPMPRSPSHPNSPQYLPAQYPPPSPVDSSRSIQQQQQQRPLAAGLSPQQQYLLPNPSPQDNRGSTVGRNQTAHVVASGALGGGFGPYAHHQFVSNRNSALFSDRRFSAAMSDRMSMISEKRPPGAPPISTATVPAYVLSSKEVELDDMVHNPDPVRDARLERSWDPFSLRGWINVGILIFLVVGLITLFAGYPIIHFYTTNQPIMFAFNLGGTNGTGQIPDLPGARGLIDKETPSSAATRVGSDGKLYNLVFSDEFNSDGRTFWPGDDPFWEAVDLYYWPTSDLEWYHPSAITTKNGKLVITMTEVLQHRLNWQSGMLQSWNKFCFTTGYIETRLSLPGAGDVPGNWAAAWTMGNLGRPGYGATTDGMWPYTYDTCDIGTFVNQTTPDGLNPLAALHTGDPRAPAHGHLSFLPGQRVSSCTCPNEDHPGPSTNVGRGVPEIDIIEAQVNQGLQRGEASQSYQVAPFNSAYEFINTSDVTPLYNTEITRFNHYKGGTYQQAISGITLIDNANYNDNGYQTYGFEYWSDPGNRDAGYVTWYVGQDKSWTMNAATIGPDTQTQIGQRLISEEPMAIVFNFGMSPGFQGADFKRLVFPQKMYVDYVRVYQRADIPPNVGCDPPSHPTADYINRHLVAYTNPNLTRWQDANFTFPRNSAYAGGC